MFRIGVGVALLGTMLGGCQIAGKGGKSIGPLTEEDFADAFNEVMCVESESCGEGSMADMWCNPSGGTTSGISECEFDAEMAQQCLDGAYTCNDTLTGFEFVEPPDECLEVYDCGVNTYTTYTVG